MKNMSFPKGKKLVNVEPQRSGNTKFYLTVIKVLDLEFSVQCHRSFLKTFVPTCYPSSLAVINLSRMTTMGHKMGYKEREV